MTKVQCKASIILGIIGIIAGLFIPIIGIGCGIAAIAVNVSRRESCKLSAGVTLGIIAIILSVVSWVAGAMMMAAMTSGAFIQ